MRAKQETPVAAPVWVVTYADMMTFLLVFFVGLLSMSELQPDRFQQAVDSLHEAFGGSATAALLPPPAAAAENPLIEKLLALDAEAALQNGYDDSSRESRAFEVSSVPEGLRVTLGGQFAFDSANADLKSGARDLLVGVAEVLRGYDTRILVRGHAHDESLPSVGDAWDLSYARAKAVIRELQTAGVRPSRLVPVPKGDSEPRVQQANTEERRAMNRRVEIVVTEDLVESDAGRPVDPLKGASDGGNTGSN